jgi:hypothetical protein
MVKSKCTAASPQLADNQSKDGTNADETSTDKPTKRSKRSKKKNKIVKKKVVKEKVVKEKVVEEKVDEESSEEENWFEEREANAAAEVAEAEVESSAPEQEEAEESEGLQESAVGDGDDPFAYEQSTERSAVESAEPHAASRPIPQVHKRKYSRRAMSKKMVVLPEVLPSLDLLDYDQEVFDFIHNGIPCIPIQKIEDLRMKDLGIQIKQDDGIITKSIAALEGAITRVFFYHLSNNKDGFFVYNPIEAVLKICSVKSYLVVKKSLITQGLFQFLFRSTTYRARYQKLHENVKRSFSTPLLSMRDSSTTIGLISFWLTDPMRDVLRKALNEWSANNSFRTQQLKSSDPEFVPFSILHLLIYSLKMCDDVEAGDTFLASTTPAVEAMFMGLIHKCFAKADDDSLDSLGRSIQLHGKVVTSILFQCVIFIQCK